MSNSKGIALVQVLFLIILIGMIEYGIVQVLLRVQSSRAQIQTRQDRQFLMKQLKKILSSPSSLIESASLATQNQELKACVSGGPIGACPKNCCLGETETGFYLVDPLDNTSNIEAKKKLTGTTTNPVYYSAKGAWCPAQTASDCDFKITTNFTARCPGSMTKCDHAEHLKIDISIEPTNFYKIIRSETLTTYYFVNTNYKPFILNIPSVALSLGTTKNITVTGDPGHPSENQNFIFSTCESDDTNIAQINCFPFSAGQAQVQIIGNAIGTTFLRLGINDGSTVNNLSDIYIVNIEVTP